MVKMTADRQKEHKERVAESVKFHRTLHHYSQAELGRMAGVSAQTIANIELEKNSVTLRTAEALAEALEISVDELLNSRYYGNHKR